MNFRYTINHINKMIASLENQKKWESRLVFSHPQEVDVESLDRKIEELKEAVRILKNESKRNE